MKRRGTVAGSPDDSGKSHKRQRISTRKPDQEAEQTTEDGLLLLEQLKAAVDRSGRLIADEFLELPDRDEYGDYYEVIGLPISLAEIENRLNDCEYTRMTPLESDLLRMVSNAKYYNEKGSLIFDHAERIRKIVAKTMREINPEYKDNPKYVPTPTRVPDNEQPQREATEDAGDERPEGMSQSQPPPTGVNGDVEDGFEGLTFREAQMKIIDGLIHMKDENNEEIFEGFHDRPNKKKYPDYYMAIEHPVSLRAILRMVRGTHHRDAQGHNAFHTWQEFEDEADYLWSNARLYNEEGSPIVELADRLENEFHRRLAEAKKVVPEPSPSAQEPPADIKEHSRTRLRLKVSSPKTPEPQSQKLKFRLPARTEQQKTPQLESRENGVTVDSEALKRQQELVRASSSGMEPPSETPSRNLRSRSGSGLRPRTMSSTSRHTQDGEAPQAPVAASLPAQQTVKPEASAPQTPHMAAITPQNQTHITPAPAVTVAPQERAQVVVPPPLKSWEMINPATRKVQRDIRKALIRNVSVSTPYAPERQQIKLDFPASPSLKAQQITIPLSPGQQVLSLIPTVTASTLARQTLLSVYVDGQKVPTNSQPTPIANTDTCWHRFDVRVGPELTGMALNRVEIDMVAAEGRGLQHLAALSDDKVQRDRIVIFAQSLGR